MTAPLPTEHVEPELDRSLKRASVVDADEYRLNLRGVEAVAVRLDQGYGANDVSGVEDEHMTVTSCHNGFSVATTTDIADSAMGFVRFRVAPPRMRWEGLDVHEDLILEYGPGSWHSGVDLAGTCFDYAVVDLSSLAEQADQLGVPFVAPERGRIRDFSKDGAIDACAELMRQINSLRHGTVPPRALMDDFRTAILLRLMRAEGSRPARRRRRTDSGRIIDRCLEYAASVGRRPSITELCLVAGVAERTLRDAFVSYFDTPPSVYFRDWALDRARERLASGEPIAGGVSDVALELGFGHFGRFARYYRGLFGENPSDTYRLYTPSGPRLLRRN